MSGGRVVWNLRSCKDVQLLHKLSIRAAEGTEKLMKVIKNPVTDHLPVGCRRIATSFHAPELKNARDVVPEGEDSIAIVVGALARGMVKTDYTEEDVKLSNFPLSAALTCTKVCSAFEEVWAVESLAPLAS